jgi:hypothetical protein
MSSSHRFGSLAHLASRFYGALSPAGPPEADERWALEQLLPAEQALWRQMSGPDRRHALGVAQAAVAELERSGRPAGREVIAAALLHDVGKVPARLGTFGRVAVTLAALLAGRRRLTVDQASFPRAGDAPGADAATPPQALRWRTRVAVYLTHDRVGGDLLQDAGSDPFTIAWAREHHLPPGQWTVDPLVGTVLKDADGS